MAEVPAGALTAFRSVKDLVQSKYLNIEKDADETEQKSGGAKPKSKLKRKDVAAGPSSKKRQVKKRLSEPTEERVSTKENESPQQNDGKEIFDFKPEHCASSELHSKESKRQSAKRTSKPSSKSSAEAAASSLRRNVKVLDLTDPLRTEQILENDKIPSIQRSTIDAIQLHVSDGENESLLQTAKPQPIEQRVPGAQSNHCSILALETEDIELANQSSRPPKPIDSGIGPLLELHDRSPALNDVRWVHYVAPPAIDFEHAVPSIHETKAPAKRKRKPQESRKSAKISPHFTEQLTDGPITIDLSSAIQSISTTGVLDHELVETGRSRTHGTVVEMSRPHDSNHDAQENLSRDDQTAFTNIVHAFEYNEGNTAPNPALRKSVPKTVPAKRRRAPAAANVESAPIDAAQERQNDSPTKSAKSPAKKRLRTVTAFAIEAHQPTVPVNEDSAVTDFFALRMNVTPPKISMDALADASGLAESKESGKKKKKAKRISKKKVVPAKPERLSPQALAKRVERQDLLFGTSSQLRREDDQSTLHQLRRALHESKVMYEAERLNGRPRCALSAKGTARGLWSAAAIDQEDIDLMRLLEDGTPATERSKPEAAVTPFVDCIDLSGETQVVTQPNAPASESCAQDTQKEPVPSYQKTHVDQTSFDARKETRRGYLPTPDVSFEAARPPNALLLSPHDNSHQRHRVFTDIQALRPLSTNVSPQKRPRGRPPKVVSADVEDVGAKKRERKVTPEASTPKKPRGRPRKVKAAECLDEKAENGDSEKLQTAVSLSAPKAKSPKKDWRTIEEIEDSEPDLTPSPPRRKSSQKAPLDLVSNLAIAEVADSTNSSKPCGTKQASHAAWSAMAAALYPQVTALIKNEPPSRGVDSMTWNEKILMYDPIVADELAQWLNARGVRVQDLSRPKKPTTKRALAAAAKAAKADGHEPEVEYDTAPLEPWMARAWCEDHGVCAVLKENFVGGRPRNVKRAKS